MRTLLALVLILGLTARAETARPEDAPFLESFPGLRNYLYVEPPSGFYIGFGLTPVAMMKDKVLLAANFFQLHWIGNHLNWEVFSASFGRTIAQQATYQANEFVFRTAPKLRIGEIFSFGPMAGYEFLNFPNVTARLYNEPFIAPDEPFSSKGAIYGLMASQTFHYNDKLFQVSETIFRQTYSVSSSQGWQFLYDSADIAGNTGLIGPGTVVTAEFSFLF